MEENLGIIHASGDDSARSVGQRNILQMAEWLAKFGYTTPEILCQVIGVKGSSQKRIVKRLVEGHWARLVPCPSAVDGYCEKTRVKDKEGKVKTVTSAPMLLVPTGKSRTLFSIKYGVEAARAMGTSSAERIFHDLSVQRIAIDVMERANAEWIEYVDVWPGVLHRIAFPTQVASHESPPAKYYDAVVIFSGGSRKYRLGLEVELSRKDKNYGLHDAFEKIGSDVKFKHIDAVHYYCATQEMAALYDRDLKAWPGLFVGFNEETEQPRYQNNLLDRVSFFGKPEIFMMRFH